MRTMMRNTVALVLALTVLCWGTLALAALPDPVPVGGKPDAPGIPSQTQMRITNRFGDLSGFTWAWSAIEGLTLAGVIQGYEDASFRPGNQITRTEALTMALRLMGYTDADAQVIAEEPFPAEPVDFLEVPGWAQGYVGLGIAEELIPGEGIFGPAEPALRNWAAMLLVRAAGLEAEAQEQMNTPLDFTDAGNIPEDSIGYIAVAVAHGLIRGFPDGSMQPNAPITRAQMAVLMERAEAMVQAERGILNRRFTGIVRTKSDPSGTDLATITLEDEDVVYEVAPTPSIYLRDLPADWADILVGDKVQLRLNEDGQVIFIVIRAEQEEFEGTVTDIDITEGFITITVAGAGTETFILADHVVVRFRGSQVELDSVKVGVWVELKVVHGMAWIIIISEEEDE